MSFQYNSHNLRFRSIDLRNGTVTYGYDAGDRITSETKPPAGNGQSQETSTVEFDWRGRIWRTTFPDGSARTNEYYASGELKATYGSRIYPTAYSYDAQGRLRTMTNWGDFASSTDPRVTSWDYNIYNGLLSTKTNAGSTAAIIYGYGTSSGNAKGRLVLRISARSVTTSYAYNNAGELSGIAYNNGSPGVSFTYDRSGRMRSAVHNNNTVTYSYTAMGLKTSEAYSGTGTLGANGGLIITNTYDSFFRPDSVYIDSKKSETLNAYGYDSASRLTNVTDNVYSAAYSYAANSHLIESVTSKENSDVRLATFRSYDKLNRLMSVSAANFSQNLIYNKANQRTRAYLSDGSYWAYQYDSLGQVISAKKFWNDNTPVAGQQFEYSFDDIGNRTQTRTGGDENGAGLRAASYSPTIQNTYSSREVPGLVNTFGLANAAASVTVNGQPTYRRGEYYNTVVSVPNTNSAAYDAIITSATLGTSLTVTNHVFVPQSPESFFYDADGNLTSDGHWTNIWNVENRITQMESLSSAPAASKRRLQFEYDFIGRRIRKKVFTWNTATSTYGTVPAYDIKFVYDGWNLLAELNATNNAVIRSYLWGADLSGTLQGAGGVGGLLAVKPAGGPTHFAVCDANGNVDRLVDGSTGEISALYEYGPFGEPIRVSGAMANLNPFRYSTKYMDDESGFVYYGYRYYNPEVGRWLSRDPIGEHGGLNLYAILSNNCVGFYDILGRASSQLQDANNQFNEAIAEWADGNSFGRSYGPNDPWTLELRKRAVYDRMREEIKRMAHDACKHGTTDGLLNKMFNWDDSADDHPMTGPFRDLKNYVFETDLQSTGSTKAKFKITFISCCPGQVCYYIKVSDVLRTGSLTRIPGTSLSLLPDFPEPRLPGVDLNSTVPFGKYHLSWEWSECLKFSF